MWDLHTHTLLSDGALTLAEHLRRAECAGYKFLGISDHADLPNLAIILPPAIAAANYENRLQYLRVLAGAEITHVRPEQIADAVQLARKLGAFYVMAHGETIAEPVQNGTNRAAIEAGVDILAHPGLIAEDDAKLAAASNVMLEITAKRGHCLTNGHVLQMARKTGAKLIFGSDAHSPEQMVSRDYAEKVMRGAGMSAAEITAAWDNARQFAEHCLRQAYADRVADW